jgi:hypothetical protein
MKITQTVAQILDSHVTLELECIDRMYLNLYVPGLQHVNGAVGFFPQSSQAADRIVGVDGTDQQEICCGD